MRSSDALSTGAATRQHQKPTNKLYNGYTMTNTTDTKPETRTVLIEVDTISYTLRDIPVELWNACRKQAKAEGRSMRGVIDLLLKAYAAAGMTKLEAAASKSKAA